MAADSVGQIGLDLVVNQNQFKQQMAGIQGLAKKAGAALAAAFAVKKIIDFGAQCIELGSDLAEVQNVVDVTFPRMSKQVDDFAKNAITSFGLSETMAKRFTGTFGAMAKAFGFGEQAAYEMSTTLTLSLIHIFRDVDRPIGKYPKGTFFAQDHDDIVIPMPTKEELEEYKKKHDTTSQ